MNNPAGLLLGTTVELPSIEQALDFDAPEQELVASAAAMLADQDPAAILQAIKSRQEALSPNAARHLYYASVAKPLMNKFCLGYGTGTTPGYRVWLHEYIESASAAVYVQGMHNQRYPIVSLILRDGYDAEEYRLTKPESHHTVDNSRTDLDYWTSHIQSLQPEHASYATGDVMSLLSSEAHALSNIGARTLSLALELPAVRELSTAQTMKPLAFCPVPTYSDKNF